MGEDKKPTGGEQLMKVQKEQVILNSGLAKAAVKSHLIKEH